MNYEIEERAAIYEFEAGMTRAQAEMRAFREAADKIVGIPAGIMKADSGLTQMEMVV